MLRIFKARISAALPMALPQRRPTLGPLLLSLLAVALPAARAWTAGNVVAVTVGDGTVAGAAAGTGSNAANCVAAQLLEFGLAAGGALPLAATGSAAAMPSAQAIFRTFCAHVKARVGANF